MAEEKSDGFEHIFNPETDIDFSFDVSRNELCYSQSCGFEKLELIVSLANKSETDFKGFSVKFTSSAPILIGLEDITIKGNANSINSSTSQFEKVIPLNLNQVCFKGLTEDSCEEITATVFDKTGERVTSRTLNVTLKPMDYWTGSPQSLPVFIERNSSKIQELSKNVGAALASITGNSSLLAYQTNNATDVLNQCAAVYSALQEQGLIYSEPLPEEAVSGQRIRSCNDILSNKTATCLDLTLLYCALAEHIGLHPIVCIIPGHAFPGVWLQGDGIFESVVHDDPADITQNCTEVNPRICILESTLLTQRPYVSFEAARSKALNAAENSDNLVIVDVHHARLQRIKPLPQISIAQDGKVIYEEDPDFKHEMNTPGEIASYELGDYEKADNTPKTKIEFWQRSLLDSSTRSSLLNVKISSTTVQILHPRIDLLEDGLNVSSQFVLIPNPLINTDVNLQNESAIRMNSELLMSHFAQNKIPTGESEKTLFKKLAQINRKAQNAMSETGVNTLYLSVGHIEWTETESSLPYRAPILLYPVNLIRKNKSEYVISLRDDEDPQLNFSIFEKFRNEFKYETSLDYEKLPTDDNGLDVRKIFAIIREEIRRQPRWRLVESCILGLFSFDQFVMWNDMRKKADELANNKIVSSLIKSELTYEPKPLPEVTDDDYVNELVPVPMDETQLQAVKAAANGNSFILQGPPGTGKSQTITAIIVDALSKGKKVLFVAEKMAALQVVYRNLKKVNASDYLLELHSTKVTKSHLIEQLNMALERTSSAYDVDDNLTRQISSLNKNLSEYITILHKKNKCGLSLYELINKYEALKESGYTDLDYLEVQSVKESSLEEFRFQLENLERGIEKYKPLSESPYRFINLKEFKEDKYNVISEKLGDLSESLRTLSSRVGDCLVGAGMGKTTDISLREIGLFDEIRNCFEKLRTMDIPVKLACSDPSEIAALLELINEYERNKREYDKLIGDNWNTNILLELNIPSLLSDWNDCKDGLFKRKQRKALISKVDSYSTTGGITEENVEEKLRALNQASSLTALVKESRDRIPVEYLKYSNYTSSQLDEVKGSINVVQDSVRRLCRQLSVEATDAVVQRCISSWANMTDDLDSLRNAYEKSDSIIHALSLDLDLDQESTSLPITEMITLIDYWRDHLTDLYGWCNCNSLKDWFRGKKYGAAFVDRVLKGEDSSTVFNQLLVSYYKAHIEHLVRTNSVLNMFTGSAFEKIVSDLSRLEIDYRRHVIASVPARIGSVISERTSHNYSKQEILRFISTNGKRRSIRSLFNSCSDFISDICPCFLMSPMSVSQFLEPGKQLFDLVVFDEASQIQTCKAVGAIARGKELVVVGDSKQMPPTSFFKKTLSDDDEEYSVEAEKMRDLESILDDCETIGLPQARLSWHYRSNSESLICFSNRKYYNNKLKTYPSVDSLESKVRLLRVKGYYQPSDKEPNPFEAEAIVRAIKDRLSNVNTRKDSIGVITFNEKQQNLIIHKLDELFERNRSLAKVAHWDESEIDCPDKLIVKNLENIQGDERDIIMLSVTFGKTKAGRFVKNFGPIGKIGGEKRLNVAFSRARKMMEIYTVINVDEFSSEELTSRGARDLQDFLKFASQKDRINSCGVSDEVVRKQIAEAIEAKGYQVAFDVGLSDFKMDIAVVNPSNPNVFFCGIMLDGSNMTTAKLTNDRFILRRNVLSMRGWKLISIRTIDWWEKREGEIERTLNQIEEYATHLDEEQTSDEETTYSNSYDDVIETNFAGEYKICELDLLPVDPNKLLKQPIEFFEPRFKQVVEFEGPILDDLLELRVLNSYNLKKRGKNIQALFDQVLSKMDFLKTVQIDSARERHYVYWPDRYKEFGENVEDHYSQFRLSPDDVDSSMKRSISDYPQVELRNIMLSLIQEKGGYIKETLIEDTAHKLGFKRIGSDITETLNITYNDAILNGRIINDGEKLVLGAAESKE